MRPAKILPVILLLVMLAFPGPGQAQSAGSGVTYYVSPSGSDANPGTQARPWKTPGYGSKRLKAGDTLVLMGGRYVLDTYRDDMLTPESGEPGAWITIRGEAGNRPVLAGRDNLYSAFEISGRSYLRIENIEITSDGGADFREAISGIGAPGAHVVFEDLYIHHIDEFAMDFADLGDARITDCVMSYCGFGCMGGPAASKGGWKDVVIDGCTLSYSGHYYRGGPGPGPYDRPDGFGVEPGDGPVEIRNTVASHNRGDGFDSKLDDTFIHECVVANNSCDGVKLWAGRSRVVNTLIYGTGDGIGGPSPWAGLVIETAEANAGFEIVNVSIHDNPSREAYPLYVQYGDGSSPVRVLFRNTVVANGHGAPYFGPSVKLTADHNLFYRPGNPGEQLVANGRTYSASDLEGGALGEGNLSREPGFVRAAWGSQGDHHLKADSPAVDGGTAAGAPSTDLDGNGRPAGAGFDMGAYEYGSSPPEPEPGEPGSRTWGQDSVGATEPACKWNLAEGCTAGGFETWVLVQNQGRKKADVAITYLTSGGERTGPSFKLDGESRATVNVAQSVPDEWEVSTEVVSSQPVICQRAMYWGNRTGAHGSLGASEASRVWFLAEGSTGGDFETWVLVQNPEDAEARVKLTCLTETGEAGSANITLGPESRRTVNLADMVPARWSVSTRVESDLPVIAERATY